MANQQRVSTMSATRRCAFLALLCALLVLFIEDVDEDSAVWNAAKNQGFLSSSGVLDAQVYDSTSTPE